MNSYYFYKNVKYFMYNSVMKTVIMTILIAIFFISCSKIDGVNPSQNKALMDVAGKEEKANSGYMQQALDNWIEKDWTPTVEKDESIKKKNEDESRDFTIQEYVDKITIYASEQNATSDESHSQKIKTMPVIGK